jgi:hypothetical protein
LLRTFNKMIFRLTFEFVPVKYTEIYELVEGSDPSVKTKLRINNRPSQIVEDKWPWLWESFSSEPCEGALHGYD